MKRIEQSMLLAGLLALAACSSTGTSDTSDSMAATQGGGLGATAGTSDSGTTISSDSATTSSYGSTAGSVSTASGSPTAVTTVAVPSTPNSTVTGIEVLQRQPNASGSTSMGSSASGYTGTSPSGDRTYRITLRLDDGSTQVVTQEWAPSFSTGDRVRVNSGAILR
ncbi:MAG: hypothetical protein V4484_04045 [Pseudomonadota bacterium]